MTPGRGDDPRALIRYALAGLVLTTLLLWTAYLVRDALLLIYISALLAIGLAPSVKMLERQRMIRGSRLPRWGAILVIYLIGLLLLVIMARLVLMPLAAQARELWTALPEMIHTAQQWLIDRGLLTREFSLRDAVQQTPAGTDAVTTVVGAVWGFIGGIFGFVTILILAFYLLLDAETFVNTFLQAFPRAERPRVEHVCRRITTKVSAWLGGQLLLGGIIGASAALGLFLLGVPYFYVLALIAGVGEMIPIVGPLLAAIPAVVVALTVSPAKALAVAVFFFLQQQFENHVLVPKVMERQVGVSAAGVIAALLIGGTLLGIVGAILAVPTVAVVQVVYQELLGEGAVD